ncbi:MAG: hypothetical protein FJY85_00740 [Deltaproteobacteria bacterium]|nr:hypothetical protein [Deltaproteobacteria bacterium]
MHLSHKKLLLSAIIIALLGLLALLLVLVIGRDSGGSDITISVEDLAEMKELAHEYLNERKRAIVSNTPDNDANVADAPVIDPSDMSTELTKRQKEDVGKLLSGGELKVFSDFAVYTKVLDIVEKGDDVVLCLRATTFYRNTADPDIYTSTATDRYFTFTRMGDGWILADVKLTCAGTMPPEDEPNVKPNDKGTSRVLEDLPAYITEVPKEIEGLDEAATRMIINEWALDEEAANNYH